MSLKDDSINLIKSLHEQIPENNISFFKDSHEIFLQFFSYFKESAEYINSSIDLKNHLISDEKISSPKDVPKAKHFDYIVKEIRDYIFLHAKHKKIFKFKNFLGREISFNFTITNNEKNDDVFHYVYLMLIWLYVISKYTQNSRCSKKLNIFIYFNDKKKHLPENKGECFEKKNVNTGFTFTCIPDSEIVIFRKEEWFKVFLHETFHNFGLDFSELDNQNTKKFILSIFPVNSKVKLYEAYTDFWARTINCLLCSFMSCNNNKDEFLTRTISCVNYERHFSFFQAVKNLNHMNMTYTDLFSKEDSGSISKREKYKEATSVLSYYIVCSIFFNNFEKFLKWCVVFNGNTKKSILIQFKNTPENQMELCEYIRQQYKSKEMIDAITIHENIFLTTKNRNFLKKTLRKSICEFV
jgi:hypothetical protein